MIDKLEVGVKYKLVDVEGYITVHPRNKTIVERHMTDDGCLILTEVTERSSGGQCGCIGVYVAILREEMRYFTKYEEPTPNTPEMEYRVIRRSNKHQVCGWRKGAKLYEDSCGTLVRNEKLTKFYTDIVEWRECQDVPTGSLKVATDIIKKLNPQQLKNFSMILNAEIAALTLSRSNRK
jgi:hypothetical protein